MAWTSYQKFLALFMVITGSFNTLSVKYSDRQIIADRGDIRVFKHPFMQSSFMFLGELLCLLVFKIAMCYHLRLNDGSVDTNTLTKGTRNFNPLILALPAMCDLMGTSTMYIGLTMTNASSFQMLRGAVIIFTGVLSVAFLEKKLGSRKWTGMIIVIFGLLLVGLSDVVTKKRHGDNTNTILTGDLLIILAQVITAVQMVLEEKFVAQKDIPALQAVGWEGFFGLIGISLLMIPLNYIHAPPPFTDNSQGTLESSIDALVQIKNSGRLLMAIVGITLSIAFFNFAGISVTKELSATTRMVLDSIRTIVIWAFSLQLGWQDFHYLQIIGFIVLFTGISCYNDVIIPQLARKLRYRLGRHQPPAQDQERVISIPADDAEHAR